MPFLHTAFTLFSQFPEYLAKVLPQLAVKRLRRYFGMKTT